MNKEKKKQITIGRLQLLSMGMLSVIFLLVFAYTPMFGLVLAFTDGDYTMNIVDAMFKSDFVGFDNFKKFFIDPEFYNVVINTLGLNILSLVLTFPAPIIFALLLNEMPHKKFRRSMQTLSYMPYFLSWIVFGGIVLTMLDPQTGILNDMLVSIGLVDKPINFGKAEYFWQLMIITGLIKGVGWGSIIYSAAISGVDVSIFEAAKIDGASRLRKAISITLPSIAPTITVFLILSISGLLNSGFDQIWVFRNQMNLERSQVIDTFVYSYGILEFRYSYTTAIGLLKSVLALILLSSSNLLSKKITGRGIF